MPRPVMIITGGSRGIGAATALLAAQQGYDICFSYYSQQTTAQHLAKNINALGANVIFLPVDLASEADILKLFATVDSTFGRVDALVNNAGILRKKLVVDIESTELQHLFNTNVIGSMLCTREAIQSSQQGYAGKK